METERNIWLSWRRFAAPFLALILTGLLLAAWLSIVSAHELKSSAPISQGNSLSNSKKVAPGPIGFRADQNGPISTTMLTPLAEYDLEIQKSQSPQEFTVGGDNTYIVYITRLNSEAVPSGFSVEDTLPDGMSLTPTATIGNWDCSASTVQKLTCFYTKNITGTALIDPLQFNVNVDPNISDSVTNTAQLYFDGAAKFSMVVTPISKVDLVLSKIQTPVVVQSLNTLISYTLTITNHGLAIADNVIVTETLPAELQPYTTTNLIPSVNPSKGSFNPETNIWTIGNMNQGEVQRLVLLTRPKTIVYGKSITNLARASSDNRDWNPGDNIASSSFVVGGVEISKSFYPNHIILYTGDIFTFTIAMTNASSSPVSNVLVQDVLTDTLDFVDCKIIYSSTPPMPPNCEITNRNLNTYLNFTSGQRAWVVIRVRGNEGTGATPFTFKNHASVTWGSPSFTLNSNEVEGAIFPTGSLQVRKTDQAIQVKRSQLVSYTISISNAGNLATDFGTLVVTDTFLANLDFFSIDKNDLVMNEINGQANIRAWSIPEVMLAPGQVISFTICARIYDHPFSTSVINQVYATARDVNARTLNAASQDVDSISNPEEILTVDMAASKTAAFAGATFLYTITVKNYSLIGINAFVNDHFSNYLDITDCRLSYLNPSIPIAGCYVYNNDLVTYVSLSSDQIAQIVIKARGNIQIGNQAKLITNSAWLTWGVPFNVQGSNNVDITIFPGGYLELDKHDGLEYVFAGQHIFYTLSITNTGSLAIPANTLRITDTFMSNVFFNSIFPNGLAINQVYNAGNTHSWKIRNRLIHPGESLHFFVGAEVSSCPTSNVASNYFLATAKDIANRVLPVVSTMDDDEIVDVRGCLFLPIIRVYSNFPTPTPTPTAAPYPPPLVTEAPTAIWPTIPPPLPTVTPVPYGVYISHIFYKGGGPSERDEYVEIGNSGYPAVNLQNWWISANNELAYFTFGPVTLAPDQVCRVYTNQSWGLNWCGSFESPIPIWDNTSDCASLIDPNDHVIYSYCYP